MTLRKTQWDRVTFVSVLIVLVVAFVVVRVLTGSKEEFTPDQRTMVIQGALSAMAMLTGFWLNGTPDTTKTRAPGSTEITATTTPTDSGKSSGMTASVSATPETGAPA